MKIIGIVAEYNPFHTGHAWHIQETRRLFQEETAVVAVMSGNWVQRGECAVTDKWTRTEMALAGGVDLELSNEEVQWVNAYLNEYNMLRNMPIDTDYLDTSLSGMIHLNGPQALAYSRNRYIGTDFGRTERQRKVLSAVIKKLPLAAVTNMKELIDGLFPNLTTNLTKGECLRLSLQAGKFAVYELVQSSVPVSGTYSNASIRGMTVLQVDFEANKKYLQEQIYGE